MKRTLVERVAWKIHACNDCHYPPVRKLAEQIIAMVRRHDKRKGVSNAHRST